MGKIMYVILTREFKALNSKDDIAFYLFDEDEEYQQVILLMLLIKSKKNRQLKEGRRSIELTHEIRKQSRKSNR